MSTVSKHFVEYLSPGTFVAESTSKEIASWDVDEAVRMACDISERHGARPYGFRFTTRTRGPDDLDSRETARSGVYYLGGLVETLEDVRRRASPDDDILISNMEINGYDRIVTNTNSWRWTQPLRGGDTVLDVVLPPRKNDAA